MDPKERYNDSEEALRTAVEGLLAKTWTAMPGIVQSFDRVKMTCEVQPAILGQQRAEDGSIQNVQIPLLLDVPIVFPSAGGYSLTFPVQQGDEVVVVFADRCIDGWWQSGGVQAQAELRMHDLSDGFAIAGIRSQPRVLSGGVSTNSCQLRTDDGTAFIDLSPGRIKLVATNINIEASSRATIGADGCGYQFNPGGINTFTDGTSGSHSEPTPPR